MPELHSIRVRAARRRWNLRLAILLAASLSLAGEGATAQNAALPNFSGLWQKEGFGFIAPYMTEDEQVIDGHKNPILKPWTAEVLLEKAHNYANGRLFPVPHDSCWPDGVPGVLGLRDAQILQTPTEVTILYRNDNQVRHIYLNKPHNNPVLRGWYGESVGHFEGDTLVVDTVGFLHKPQATVDRHGTPVTEALHVVERYRLIEGGKKMEIRFSVDDANVYKKPWSLTLTFTPRGVMAEEYCSENNRDFAELVPMAERPDF